MNFIILWFKYAANRISQRMAYRAEYFISLVSMFVLELFGPILAYAIYYNSPGFEGWTFHQVLLLQGIFLIVRGFSFFAFFGVVWNANFKLKKGDFDLIFLKPRNLLYIFVCDSFDAEDTGKFIGGILVTIYALFHIESISGIGIIFALISIIAGIGFMFSIALFMSSFIIRFIQAIRVYEFIDIISIFGQYPKDVYPKAVNVIFTAFIPLFAVASMPASALFGVYSIEILYAVLASAVIVFIAIKTWYSVIKNYSSAGG